MAGSRNSRSPDPLIDALRGFLARHAVRASRIAVGLSGGRDSVALLHALAQLRDAFGFQLSALHLHHGLSHNADGWADFCTRLCEAMAVPFQCSRVSVDRASGQGIEAAARAARYAAFAALDADWIVLAHHRGDQAETVLHNLLRGTGLRGLSGMPGERALSRGGGARLMRPLLGVPRAVIDDYVRGHALEWVEDESNRDSGYTRNWLRNEILPALAQHFPAAQSALARTATLAAEAETLLDALAREDFAAAAPAGRLRIDALRRFAAPRARNLLRFVLREAGAPMPDAARLGELQRQLGQIERDSHFRFDFAPLQLRCFARELHVLHDAVALQAAPDGDLRVPWAAEAHLDWLCGKVLFENAIGCGFAADRVAGAECHLASRRGGESIRPDARRPRRSLKHWYQELGVPPWQRQARPILWCGDTVVWVAGLGIDVAFQCGDGEAGWVPHWVPQD
jgi:tRNA(Ile)-lysidine synthase